MLLFLSFNRFCFVFVVVFLLPLELCLCSSHILLSSTGLLATTYLILLVMAEA